MKKTTLLLTLALGSFAAFSQTEDHSSSDHLSCGQAIETNRLRTEFPEFATLRDQETQAAQIEYQEFLESWSPDDRASYTIPIVFHIVHLGGSENISDAQVYSAIEQMNRDFNNENDDLDETIPEFVDLIGNNDIDFRLATKDPSGNCHPGITRTYSNTTYDNGAMGSSSHPIIEAVEAEHGTWPQNKYLNIFVCIDPAGNGGYTYRPTNWFPANRMYGSILVRHTHVGTTGTANPINDHTLSHEAGHWLDLAHPWGGTNTPGLASNCSDDDGIFDTPNTVGWDNCSNTSGETCGSLDNVQNIMDYSYCSTMFTQGQSARVQNALLGFTAERYKLSTEANLIATGTDAPGELCAAKFSANTTVICAGGSVDFADNSYHTITARSWNFEGGSPSVSTLETPTITYNTPGVYNVTLNASNGGSTETASVDNYIVVLPENGAPLPYKESFETLSSLEDGNRFIVENTLGDATWEITDTDADLGVKSAYISNYGVENGSKDGLVSGTLDLSDVSSSDGIVFTFKYANERREEDNDEWLRFYISSDCGETWILRKNIHGDALGENVSDTPFAPTELLDWTEVEITSITPPYYVSNFRFKIEFENNNGNNIYIDDINVYAASTASINEIENDLALSVYPNPLGENTTVQFNAQAGENYNVILYNAIGEKLTTIHNGELTAGKNSVDFNTNNLAKGIYILRVETQGEIQTIKLTKN